jgi:hypothetical protein
MTRAQLLAVRLLAAKWVAARRCAPLALCLASAVAMAQAEPCDGFGWNVSRERVLFASTAQPMLAGHDAASSPLLATERLYDLQLTPQDQVAFVRSPGKKKPADGAFAGIARLRLDSAGNYRISVDQPFWIDVIAAGQVLASSDFQGRAGCQAPHKIVLYSLPGGQELLLQVSGTASPRARLTVTRAEPAPAP